MATKLMGDAGLLDQPLGQLICCAAMIDDVASLVLLAMISSASGTDTSTSAESDAGNNDDSENSSGDSSSSSSKQDDDVVLWGPTEGVWAVCIPLLASLLFLGASLLLAQHMPSMMRALSRATAAPPPPLASTHLTAPSNSLAASASNLTETATPPATSSTNTIAVSRTTNAAPRALNPDDEVGQSDEAPTTALWHKPRSEPSNELSNEAFKRSFKRAPARRPSALSAGVWVRSSADGGRPSVPHDAAARVLHGGGKCETFDVVVCWQTKCARSSMVMGILVLVHVMKFP